MLDHGIEDDAEDLGGGFAPREEEGVLGDLNLDVDEHACGGEDPLDEVRGEVRQEGVIHKIGADGVCRRRATMKGSGNG